MRQKKYRVKKIWNGFVSVRDYVVEDCVKNNLDLVILLDNQSMTIKCSDLSNPLNIIKREFISKFDGRPYKLYDFRWVPDNIPNQIKLIMETQR
jgi:hypothetical protein